MFGGGLVLCLPPRSSFSFLCLCVSPPRDRKSNPPLSLLERQIHGVNLRSDL